MTLIQQRAKRSLKPSFGDCLLLLEREWRSLSLLKNLTAGLHQNLSLADT